MVKVQKDFFRPLYEINAFVGWALASLLLISSQTIGWFIFLIPCLFFCLIRFKQSIDTLKVRLAISAQRLKKVTRDEMLKLSGKYIDKEKAFYLGTGFTWTQAESEIAYKISGMVIDDVKYIPKWIPAEVLKKITPSDTIQDKEAMGQSWIHGIGVNKEEDVLLRIHTLAGHVGISGTTRSGKTRLYEVLVTQMLRTNSCLIIIDPKGDKELKNLAKDLAKFFKRDFLFFHPAFPSQSVRFNPIKNWNVISDIGARIANLISADGGDGFSRFCELSVNSVCYGLQLIGVRPSLKNIRRYVVIGVDQLFVECMNKICIPAYGADWDAKIGVYMSKNQKISRTEAMADFYMAEYVPQFGANEVLDGLYSTLRNDKVWYSKMINSLTPLLQTLCMEELGELLSPDYENLEDTREIHNMESVVLGKKILYVGLDSLTNLTISKTLASMFMAELATVAGTIYNHHQEKMETYLLLDEVAEVASEQVLQILNKAGGGGFKVFMAMQSIADLESKLGARSKAIQFLDNTNTWISLRVKADTAEYVSKLMGETTVRTINTSISTNAESESHALEFKGGFNRSLKEERVPLVSPDVLMNLPNLQYFIRTGDGMVKKGRIPIILPNN